VADALPLCVCIESLARRAGGGCDPLRVDGVELRDARLAVALEHFEAVRVVEAPKLADEENRLIDGGDIACVELGVARFGDELEPRVLDVLARAEWMREERGVGRRARRPEPPVHLEERQDG
jgi:hypothetical protein